MHEAVAGLIKRARPKVRMLLRGKLFYSTTNMVMLFKTHVWGIVESQTPAIYHAARTTLVPIDQLQDSFVRDINLDATQAFLDFNMAPLCSRRDIAMLGLLYKISHGLCHPHLRGLFPPPFLTWRASPCIWIYGQIRPQFQAIALPGR